MGLGQLPGPGWETGRRRGPGCTTGHHSHHQPAEQGEVCHQHPSQKARQSPVAWPCPDCKGRWEREALAFPVLFLRRARR